MHSLFRLDIPPHVADIIRSLHPDLRRSVRAAMDEIAANSTCGTPLRGELDAYWRYRVRRFRIVYAIDKRKRRIRIMAVGHRRSIYEELAARLTSRADAYTSADINRELFPEGQPKRQTRRALKEGVRKHNRKRHERKG